MRALVLIALLTSVAGADSIKLGAKAPPVGDVSVVEKVYTGTMNVSAKGKTAQVTVTQREKKRVEVLAVAAGKAAVTKAKVTYLEASKSQQMGTRQKSSPQPYAGKAYILTAGKPLGVVAVRGTATKDEIGAIRENEERFGEPDRFAKLVARQRFVRGKPVELTGAGVADAFGKNDAFAVSKVVLTYRGKAGPNAKFDIRVVMRSKRPGSGDHLDMAGKVTLDPATGEPVALQVTGNMKQRINGQTIEGKIKMSVRSTRPGSR